MLLPSFVDLFMCQLIVENLSETVRKGYRPSEINNHFRCCPTYSGVFSWRLLVCSKC